MADAFVQFGADSTGKKWRTRSRAVGANTVQEQYALCADDFLTVGGTDYVKSGTFYVKQSIDWIAALSFASDRSPWFRNPLASAVLVRALGVEAVHVSGTNIAAIAAGELPRIDLARFTFTSDAGAKWSGAVTATKVDSTQSAATAVLNASLLDSTIVTLGNSLTSFYPSVSLDTGTQTTKPRASGVQASDWMPEDTDDCPILRAGEGLVFWQVDQTGDVSESRKVLATLWWDEWAAA